jgi:anthranilate/para-aminobenzoate synthase component I
MQFFSNNEAGLYVGGGITSLSEAEAEYNETLLKAETLLRALVKD